MFVIDKRKKIILTKGDTATIYVEVYDLDNNPYEIEDTDIVTLTVRKTAKSDISLQKVMRPDNHIVIEGRDTDNLSVGTYVYDVELETKDGFKYTIVPISYFELQPEVTV